ncbi:MAG: tetratricopeptide repeat protein [Bacteroidota bacterium]
MKIREQKILNAFNSKFRFHQLLLCFLMIAFSFSLITKAQSYDYKTAAKTQMVSGKYSEAINLLNKHVSSKPRDAEGYALRAECYDNIDQHYNAVLDWEKSTKLDPENSDFKSNYIKSKKTLDANLNKKIKGHERELAIDPSASENYLEIGKAYMQIEDYEKAEEYYDKYLSHVPETSSDEILRYAEILAKNNKIKKGEKILKEYSEKYPDDWRLQSRYGYFLMWNGKYNSAKRNFESALKIKPYFKEAQDGMDIVSRQAYVTQNNPIPEVKEYPIDRYYRLLKKDPSNDDLRLKLADELIKANRIEEAYNQYQILSFFDPENKEYEILLDDFYEYRDSVYHYRIDNLKKRLINNPKDKKSVMKIAEYYSLLEEYDKSAQVLKDYLKIVPTERDYKFLFMYAKALAWNREIDKSFEVLDGLIKKNPRNLNYKLFWAQVSIWEQRDLNAAELYVDEVLSARPNNVDALIAKATLLGMRNEFDQAQSYAKRAIAVDPMNFDVIALQSKLELQKLRAEEDMQFQILEDGRILVQKEKCDSALSYYERYLSQAKPNNLVKKEYGDVLSCAKKYDDAFKVYNEVLSDGYMYEAELERAKLYYIVGDSIKAVNAFNQLVKKEPYEFQPRLYLGDSYVKVEEYDSALAVYDSLLTWDLDSVETAMVMQRKEWIPPSGFNAVISSFPYLLGLAPAVQYYSDNLSFQFTKIGARLDIGIFKHLIMGASFYKCFSRANAENLNQYTLDLVDPSSLYGFTGKREFTTFKGHLFIPISKEILVSGSYGTLNTSDYNNGHETEFAFKYDNQKTFGITGSFLNSDAQLILFSPYLIDYHNSNGVRLRASLYKLQSYYTHNEKILISGFFDYISVSDDNEGNNFQLRVGNKFDDSFSAGYEYFFQNYKYNDVQIYYSPQNYDSHCLWGEYKLDENENSQLSLGGKLGYAPPVNQFVLEGHFNANYQFTQKLNVVGNISFGQSSQYDSAYRYLSINLQAYWSL